MLNPNWDVWIQRSVAKHFSDRLSSYQVFIEGQERSNSKEWIEVRLEGPSYNQLSKDNFKIDVTVNILVLVTEQDDRLRPHIIAGDVASNYDRCLNMYKYGDPADNVLNDSSFLTSIYLQSRGGVGVQKIYFGKTDPETQIHQVMLEGHYQGYLTGG